MSSGKIATLVYLPPFNLEYKSGKHIDKTPSLQIYRHGFLFACEPLLVARDPAVLYGLEIIAKKHRLYL